MSSCIFSFLSLSLFVFVVPRRSGFSGKVGTQKFPVLVVAARPGPFGVHSFPGPGLSSARIRGPNAKWDRRRLQRYDSIQQGLPSPVVLSVLYRVLYSSRNK